MCEQRTFVLEISDQCDTGACKITEVVFVPFASDDHSGYTSGMQEFQGDAGPKLVGLHEFPDQIQAISQADAIYVGGGNSFLLVKELHELLIPSLKQLKLQLIMVKDLLLKAKMMFMNLKMKLEM